MTKPFKKPSPETIFGTIAVAVLVVFLATGTWLKNQASQSPKAADGMSASDTGTKSAEQTEEIPVVQTQEKAKEYRVKVFFALRPDSDIDPAKAFAVERTTSSLGVATFAISQLIKGPTPEEAAQGYYAELKLDGESACSGNDFTISITDATATLKFCRTVVGTGTLADGRTKAQIEATLKQFSSIKEVVILTRDDDCLFDQSGQNLCKQ